MQFRWWWVLLLVTALGGCLRDPGDGCAVHDGFEPVRPEHEPGGRCDLPIYASSIDDVKFQVEPGTLVVTSVDETHGRSPRFWSEFGLVMARSRSYPEGVRTLAEPGRTFLASLNGGASFPVNSTPTRLGFLDEVVRIGDRWSFCLPESHAPAVGIAASFDVGFPRAWDWQWSVAASSCDGTKPDDRALAFDARLGTLTLTGLARGDITNASWHDFRLHAPTDLAFPVSFRLNDGSWTHFEAGSTHALPEAAMAVGDRLSFCAEADEQERRFFAIGLRIDPVQDDDVVTMFQVGRLPACS